MKNFWSLTLFSCLLACTGTKDPGALVEPAENHELIFHYSVLKALDNGILEGNMTVPELLRHGDHGLGTFNQLNGEMIVLGGMVYRVTPEGKVVEAQEDVRIPYAVVSFFDPDMTILKGGDDYVDYGRLNTMMDTLLPSRNQFYALRITGHFRHIMCGGVDRQERPYDRTLLEILSDRPVYEKEDVHGTMVGIWCPAYIGDINTRGFHLHFLADDRSMGGHVMAFEASSLEIQYDGKWQYKFVLPGTEEFKKAKFRESAVNY
jgi:acetolactate decarboxylase